MNIPIGEIIEKNLLLKELNIEQKLTELLGKEFNGYIVLTIEGAACLEEGLLLLKNNSIIGAIFEYIRLNKIFYGNEALLLFFNAAQAKNGVADIGALTRQQIDLIIAFNEEIELSKAITSRDLPKLITKKYDSKYASEAIGKEQLKKESKYAILKKLGLGGVK